MPQLLLIQPKERKLEVKDLSSIDKAKEFLNLDGVDFGSLTQNIGIIVYEFGLMRGKPDEYFRISTQLFNGNAIIFQTDDQGETISIIPPYVGAVSKYIAFYNNPQEMEKDILLGNVLRPQTSINGEILWQWKGA